MQVILSGLNGFCQGVTRAVKTAEEACEKNGSVLLLGELIHNESVTASLESEGLDKKDVTGVNDFSFINVPAGYNISPITNNISVTLIGPAEDIAKITAMDIVVQADFSNIDIQSESFSVPITILVPQYKNVWAYMPSDQYTTEVFVEASKKTAEETTSLNSPSSKESVKTSVPSKEDETSSNTDEEK